MFVTVMLILAGTLVFVFGAEAVHLFLDSAKSALYEWRTVIRRISRK